MQQESEGLFELAVDDAILGDDQSGEDGLVELAPELWPSGPVSPVAVAQQGQAGGQVGLDSLEGQPGGSHAGLGPGDVAAQALLLAAEQFERDGVGVVSFQELVLLFPEHLEVPGCLSPILLDLLMASTQFGAAGLAEGVEVLLGELDGLPVVLHELLDRGDENGLLPAIGPLLLATDADQVGVDDPLVVLGIGQDEPGAALAAPDAALQVVVVDALLLPGPTMSSQHGLDLLEQFLADDRGVLAVVLGALEVYLAQVVAVVEHPVDRAERQRLLGVAFG